MNINYSIFTLLIPLIIQISPCSGTAKLMLRFDSFENTGFLKENGECCDGERRNGNCTGRCDYSIRVCLSRNATGDPCEIETFEVGTVDVSESSFNFPDTFVSGFANPVPISLNSWQGDIIVTLYINDEDTLREERVDSFNLTYTRFAPVSNRPIADSDFQPYTLIGKRVVSPTRLDIDVTAQCDRFFYGEECLVNCVENDDCNGHYTCNGETGEKICNEGWGGDNCSISESADHGCFASQTCSNNAECIRYGNLSSEYYCCCAPGYTGTNCEIDIDECESQPCGNGGSCTQDEPNSFTCFCPIRYKGIQCQTQRDCSDDPCINGGQCRSVVGSFFCICNENYTGDICETSLVTTPAPTTPACPLNYYGPSCSVFCEPRDDCSGHYGCDTENGNRICNPTWGGVNCTNRSFVDTTCPCVNGGQCFDNQCCCPEGFSGSLCERQLCRDGLCLNEGQCYEENNGYRCECRQGFTGQNCETVLPTCPADFYGPTCSVFCRPQEDCYAGQWSCNPTTGARQCRFGWTGRSCNQRDPTARHRVACPDSDCRNGGVCANSTCCCPAGYTGSLCHIEILECASNPCQNNARCEDLIADYLCMCRPGFTGKNCENFIGGIIPTEEPDPCMNVNCLNGGTCASNSSTAAICLCQEGFMGDRCEISVRTTIPGQQICPENYYGPSCLIYCREEDSCERGHFYCDPATGQRICKNGWIGTICNTRVLLQEYDPECPTVGCRNRGQCFNGSCCCPDNSQGEFCQVEILACDTQPCQNGGTCQDVVNGYTCSCPVGFTGVDCTTIVETTTSTSTSNTPLQACDQDRCQNGGVCIPTLLPFSCLCPNPFSGRYCEINMSGTSTTTYLQTIYLRGNVSDSNQAAIQEILQRAVSSSATSSSCCVVLYIVEKTSYVDQAGDVVVGYVYNVTHSSGGTITPGQTDSLNAEVNRELQRTDPFRRDGVVVYTGPVQLLTNIGLAYSMDFIGEIPASRRQSVIDDIEAAWRSAYPDCQCQFRVNIATTEEYAGEYGIKISRVYYIITRDGQTEDPAATQQPPRNFFINILQGRNSVNKVYAGSFLLPYNQRHSILLNGVMDLGGEQGRLVRDTIRSAWIQWKNTNPAVPENLRNAEVDIIMLRPSVYYTQDGRRLSNLEYFVVFNNTIIIGPQGNSPTINSPLFCNGCDAIPVPFVDIKGSLSSDQIRTLGANLNPADPSGVTINSEQFINSNGDPVTRIYYQPPISGPGVESTAVSQQRLATILNILNLEQPSLPIDRTFAVTFAGTVTDSDRDGIRQSLTNAWADTFGIPREQISVSINSMNNTFTSSSGNGQLTQVSYTVSVQGADSHWTRFEGLNLDIIRQYITSPNFVIVGGEGTLPTLQTTPSVNGQTTSSPISTTTISFVETIYLSGNISDNNQGAVEEVLQNALNKSRNGEPCCVTLYIIERTTYTDPSGQTVTGYRYNISSSNGTPPTLTPEQRRNFTSEISTGLQNVDFFRQFGVVIYTGSIQDLQTAGVTYSVDFIGDVPESQRQAVIAAIERAWHTANPGCGCQFQANIERTEEFTGDYGIRISKLFYTMTRDGQQQDPNTVAPPSRNILYATSLRDTNTNPVYTGSLLFPYDQHHSILLNGVIDLGGDQVRIVRESIQRAWVQFRDSSPAFPENLRNAEVDIIMLRPSVYYTQDGRRLSNLEYFVVFNNTIIIGPQGNSPTINSPLFCNGCDAIPVPFVDIKGSLSSDQIRTLGANLNPADPSGVTINSEQFINSNGDPVTRIYYQPPISGPGVESTAVSQQRLATILNILNLEQPSMPIDRTFAVTFAGTVTDSDRDGIRQSLTNAWADTFGIPREQISVSINSMNNTFTSSSGNGQLTQVSYTVSVQGADSHWTRFEGLNLDIIRQYITSPNFVVVGGEGTLPTLQTTPSVNGQTTSFPISTTTISSVETIYLSGNISDNNQGAVEEVLQNAINKSRSGEPCCVTLYIIERTTYTDPSGQTVTGYRYNISSSNGTPPTLTPEQRRNFTSEISTGLQNVNFFRQFGVVIYTGSIQDLQTAGVTYSVDFIGDVPESQRQAVIAAIERAWYTANPGCGCQFQANIERTEEFTGDYGIRISRLFYTMTRDGQQQDPNTVAPPSRNVLYATSLRDTNTNPVYSGFSLVPYDQHHSILLNSVIDLGGDQGRIVRESIQRAWVQFRDSSPALPPALRNAPLEILLLRPKTYYTPDGRELTNVEYFVVLNGTVYIGPQAANVSLSNNPLFCESCRAVPVPSVDVNGRLSPDQLLELGLNLDPTDTNGDYINSELFLTPNGGSVTRVFYRPPISGPDVQSTAVSQQRLNEILTSVNLQQPSQPTERTFFVNFAGRVGNNNRDTIRDTIINAWATTYGIPREAISVEISNIDDNFRSISNGQVTQVTYTVSVQEADSQWTRYNGVDLGILSGYFTPIGLVIVREDVTRTQGPATPGPLTTGPGDTTPVSGGITVPASSSNTTFLIQTIFLRGNISNNNQGVIEDLLQTALNTSVNGTCCRTLQILDKVTFLDPLGDVIVGYRYNVSNTTGNALTPLTPREILLFQTEVLDQLRRTQPFIQLGTVLYTGSIDDLTSVQFTYTVDFIGDIPYSWRAAVVENIEAAWRTANPGCQCIFRGNFVYADKYSGDYGLTVSRVYYTMTRDGRTQDPNSVQPPVWTVLANQIRGDNRINFLYSGAVLLPYRLHHNVLLSGVVDMSSQEGRNVRNLIETAWLNWRNTNPAVPPNLRTATLEIVLQRPQMYYTQDGKQLTYLEYFVVLNGTVIIGSESANVPLTDPIFCDGCPAIPIPFVEVQDQLTTNQLRILGNRLNPADALGTSVRSESYINTNGQVITRVYYQPPISEPGVQSTALSPQRVADIFSSLGLQQPWLPEERTFTINFAGSINNNNRNVIEQTIRNAWVGTFNIPNDVLSVEIISMNDSFINTASNGQVTQVTYRVTIQGADSMWTRFEGLAENTIENYFRPTSLVIIRGEIQTTRPSTITPRPTTGTITTTQTIYIRGNVTNQNLTVVEEILQNALNRSRNGSTCCLTVHVIEWTSYVDPTGDSVIGYTYNVTNGSEPVTLTPEEVTNFTREINNEIVTISFIDYGYVLYTGTVEELKNVNLTYTVDFVGDIPDSQRGAVISDIERAWQNANPGCGCIYTVSVMHIEKYNGDYGTTVNRVYYTISRDGQVQDPATVQPPSQNVFQTTAQTDDSVSSVYTGSSPLPYNQRHTVLLNTAINMDSDQGTQVQNAIRSAWISWRNTDPSVSGDLRSTPIDIVFLRPQTYYTQDGRNVTNVEYFVLLNNSIVIGPQRANISLTGSIFCGNSINCVALPVPFVDVNGDLTTDQILGLGSRLNPSDPSGSTLSSQVFISSNNEPVTRVFYRPPISGPEVQSTAVSQQSLNEILTIENLDQPSLPIERTYRVYFAGSIGENDKSTIEETIKNAWRQRYGMGDVLSVNIQNMNDTFYSTASNGQVTQVDYTVSVQGVDSHWTRFEGVDDATLGQYFTNPDLTVVLGEVTFIQPGETITPGPTDRPFLVTTIYLIGNISENNQPALEEVLQNVLNRSLNGSSCCLTLRIIGQTTYMDPSGNVVVGYQYNVSNTTGGAVTPMMPNERTDFINEVNNELQRTDPFRQFGTVIYTGREENLIYIDFAYSVDIIGDIPDSLRRGVISDIERVWQNANPGCNCLYKVSIVNTGEYSGEYGIKVTRVMYTITKDGQIQNPATTQPPSRNIFFTTLQDDTSVSSLYLGSLLMPYSQRHSVLVNGVVDMASSEGTQVTNAILSVWRNWRNVHPAVPESLRNTPVEIRLLRTEPYYTQDGRVLTRLEYFVVLNGTQVVGPQANAPQITGPYFCEGCAAISVPYVDVKGPLSPTQLQQLSSALNPADSSGSNITTRSFLDDNNELVTRVYYQPPISGPQVQSTAISQQRLAQILTNQNLEQPSLPLDRTYAVNFAGSIGFNSRDNIEQTIKNVWSGTFNIPADTLTINIVDMDDNYISTTSNSQVTKVTYTVTIQGADSYWTRFEGVDPGTLGRYFTSPDLVVVGGEVIFTQYLSSTPESSSATPTQPPVLGSPFIVQTMFFKGNVSDENAGAVQTILQTALNQSMTGMSCCVMVTILEKMTYADPSGDIYVGYRYNLTNSTGSTVQNLAPEQTNNFRTSVNNQLQRIDPFRQDGIVVYTGSVQGFSNIGVAYYIDFIGSVPGSRRTIIVKTINSAWRTAYPDCDCQFSSEILLTVPLSGDYGIAITRVYYTMKRDDQVQSVANVPGPAADVFLTTVQGDISVNSVYSGSSLLPYNQRHSVLLRSVVDITGTQGNQVQAGLLTAWNTWRNKYPNLPQSLRSGNLEIILLRPQTYYTQSGTLNSNVEYFVIIDGKIIGPGTANPSLTGPLFCGCRGIPVPFVDVNGHLDWSKTLQLGTSLNPNDTLGSTLSKEIYYDANGLPVTRLFYRPQISDSSVQSSAIDQVRLTEILTSQGLEQPSLPIRKSFNFYLTGILGEDHENAIKEGIMNAWGGSFAIPTEDISVYILNMNGNFYKTNSTEQVTRVIYTLSIQGADSRWTKYEGINNEDLSQFFQTSSTDVILCACTASEGRQVMLTAAVGNDTSFLKTALINAWMDTNPDYKGKLSVAITKVEGATPTTLKYTVTGNNSAIPDSDLTPPSVGVLNNNLEPIDNSVYIGDKNDDSASVLPWAIPVGIILFLLLLLLIILIIFCVIRRRRNRMSHTLKQRPEDMNGYDKQHFSDEPHFENPAFDMDDPEVGDSKQRTYIVNEDPNMEEIKLR